MTGKDWKAFAIKLRDDSQIEIKRPGLYGEWVKLDPRDVRAVLTIDQDGKQESAS